MYSLNHLVKSLNSFRNLYAAVLRCIEKDSKNSRLLSPVIGLTMNSTRHRIRNPQLWQVSEIKKLAVYYKLPTSACENLSETLPNFWSFWGEIPIVERREIEKRYQFKAGQLDKIVNSHSPVTEIDKQYHGLNNWLTNRPSAHLKNSRI